MKKVARVLQCVYSMNRGGVESWLMHVLRRSVNSNVHIDFLVHVAGQSDYEQEILDLGSRVFRVTSIKTPWRYQQEFGRILSQHGPYSAVHSHSLLWDGLILAMAARHGIPVRIAHSHNDMDMFLPNGWLSRSFALWNLRLARSNLSHGLACSRAAAKTYFGPDWDCDPRLQVLLCGLDFSAFYKSVDPPTVRQSLNIAQEAYVVGHVGSFRGEQKNQKFIVHMAKAVRDAQRPVIFLLIGDGSQRSEIEALAKINGVADRVYFTGVRNDIPQIMSSMDMFVFPSVYEGLGLALIEAQAAGLPCLVSSSVPPEADVIPFLVKRLSLAEGPEIWGNAVKSMMTQRSCIDRDQALKLIASSSFSLDASFHRLMTMYGGND